MLAATQTPTTSRSWWSCVGHGVATTNPFLRTSSGGLLFGNGSGCHHRRGSGRRSSGRVRSRRYERMGSCVVVSPPLLGATRPRGIIKFLGGAFVGAVPEVTYRYLMEMLAEEGFLVVSVPYNVTFDHSRVAGEIFSTFHSFLSTTPSLPTDLPLFSVAHSNGALLQLLIGSRFSQGLPKANAVVSFNNRPASEAVPFFDQLGPVYSQMIPIVEATPLYSIATSGSGIALKMLQDSAMALGQGYDSESMVSFNKFVDQLPFVFNQVRDGVSEFRPTPSENRDIFGKSYNVQNTLLVKFSSDTIDETDLVEEVLEPHVKSFGGVLEKVILSGNHLTPCIQDDVSHWRVLQSTSTDDWYPMLLLLPLKLSDDVPACSTVCLPDTACLTTIACYNCSADWYLLLLLLLQDGSWHS